MKRCTSTTIMSGLLLCMMLLATAALKAQEKMPITTSSDEARELFIEGRDLYENFKVPQSIPYFKKAVQLDPTFALAHLYLSNEQTGGADADKHFKKALELSGQVSKSEKYQIQYFKAYREGNRPKMKEHLDALLSEYPDDERTHYWMSLFWFEQDELDKAAEYLKQAVDLNADFAPAHNQLGYCQMQLGKMDQAEASFKRYMKLLPEDAAPRDSYAEFLLNQGRFDESIKYYKEALKIDPELHFSHKGLGDNYLFKEDYEMARNHYRQSHKLAPNSYYRFNSLLLEATVHLHEDNLDEATQVMDRYIELARQEDLPQYNIYGLGYKGYMLTEMGKGQEGLRYYRQAIDMIETANLEEPMRKNLRPYGQVWEFYALTGNGDMQEAETKQEDCEHALVNCKNPDIIKLYHTACGIKELKKGNYEEALTYFKDTWENNPVVYYYTGLALEKSGQKEEAQKWYQKVANHYENSLELAVTRNRALAGLKE